MPVSKYAQMAWRANAEQGYPDTGTDWDAWELHFKTNKDCTLWTTENGFLAAIWTDKHVNLEGASTGIEIAWYVEPEHRNSGEGMRLYSWFDRMAREKGCKYILQGRPTKGCVKVGNLYLRTLHGN